MINQKENEVIPPPIAYGSGPNSMADITYALVKEKAKSHKNMLPLIYYDSNPATLFTAEEISLQGAHMCQNAIRMIAYQNAHICEMLAMEVHQKLMETDPKSFAQRIAQDTSVLFADYSNKYHMEILKNTHYKMKQALMKLGYDIFVKQLETQREIQKVPTDSLLLPNQSEAEHPFISVDSSMSGGGNFSVEQNTPVSVPGPLALYQSNPPVSQQKIPSFSPSPEVARLSGYHKPSPKSNLAYAATPQVQVQIPNQDISHLGAPQQSSTNLTGQFDMQRGQPKGRNNNSNQAAAPTPFNSSFGARKANMAVHPQPIFHQMPFGYGYPPKSVAPMSHNVYRQDQSNGYQVMMPQQYAISNQPNLSNSQQYNVNIEYQRADSILPLNMPLFKSGPAFDTNEAYELGATILQKAQNYSRQFQGNGDLRNSLAYNYGNQFNKTENDYNKLTNGKNGASNTKYKTKRRTSFRNDTPWRERSNSQVSHSSSKPNSGNSDKKQQYNNSQNNFPNQMHRNQLKLKNTKDSKVVDIIQEKKSDKIATFETTEIKNHSKEVKSKKSNPKKSCNKSANLPASSDAQYNKMEESAAMDTLKVDESKFVNNKEDTSQNKKVQDNSTFDKEISVEPSSIDLGSSIMNDSLQAEANEEDVKNPEGVTKKTDKLCTPTKLQNTSMTLETVVPVYSTKSEDIVPCSNMVSVKKDSDIKVTTDKTREVSQNIEQILIDRSPKKSEKKVASQVQVQVNAPKLNQELNSQQRNQLELAQNVPLPRSPKTNSQNVGSIVDQSEDRNQNNAMIVDQPEIMLAQHIERSDSSISSLHSLGSITAISSFEMSTGPTTEGSIASMEIKDNDSLNVLSSRQGKAAVQESLNPFAAMKALEKKQKASMKSQKKKAKAKRKESSK